MTDNEHTIPPPSSQYVELVAEVLDLVEGLNEHGGLVGDVRVVVSIDTEKGQQLHFLEKSYDEGDKASYASTAFFEPFNTHVFEEFEEVFKRHDDRIYSHTHKTF